ncbi:polysaccharide pyruvyl transferase family protein [Nocardioides sp. zg-ZUI104]|uniref:polysaccharide pyruvyl transferase family protein n=1 Tax=Nocardioides faecalis TaxID=2803858 RepID=UPI001BCFDF6D|nr:polysaccharide pyruvyl transferase family protein [Nocardioides faecalis]MBS4752176.1 polysaccharide pyruvyl transferase family protein [Nocardioides faecalis]
MTRLLMRSGKDPFEIVGLEESIERDTILTNSGNLVFSEAAHKLMDVPGVEVVSTSSDGVRGKLGDRINEEFDAFVVPLANAFRPSFEPGLKRLTRTIRRSTKPVVVLGVGGQAGVGGDVEHLRPMEETVKDFVSAVLDKGPSIGVRGEFTAEYLTSLGFRDVEVIGCPSMFRHGPELPFRQPSAGPAADSAISMNGSHALFRNQDLGRIVDRVRERFPRTIFIGQNNVEATSLRWRTLPRNLRALTSVPTNPEHPMYAEGKVRVYMDPSTWIRDLRDVDFSIGGRIHGNIAAILAGTPALVLSGDARTLELARYFQIPHHVLTTLPEDVDPARLLEEADWGPMVAGHRERFARFESYLDAHGLKNTFTHGDGGVSFEQRLAAVDLPGPVEATKADDLGAAREYVDWLREYTRSLRSERSRLLGQVHDLRRPAPAPALVPALVPAGAAARVREAGARVVRRLRRS